MALSLPYFYRVDTDNTIGVSPVGWVLSAGSSGSSNIIAPSADAALYTPTVTNVLESDTTSGTTDLSLQLPDSFDVTSGFRLATWTYGILNQQDGYAVVVSDAEEDDSGRSQIRFWFNLVGSSVGTTDAVNSGVNQTSLNMGTHSSMGAYHWHQLRLEYKPSANTVQTWIYQASNGFLRHNSTALTPSWSASLVNADYFTFRNAGPHSTYRDDVHLSGFWIGDLTDSFPSHDIPAIPSTDVSQDPVGAVAVSGYDPIVLLGQYVDVVQSPKGALATKATLTHYVQINVHTTPSLGEIGVAGYDPVIESQARQDPAGALAVLGYDPVVTADSSAVRLFFKFKDANGHVWTREIDAHPPVVEVSSTYIASSTEETILADASGGAFTITMPTVTGRNGYEYTIKKTDSSANAVTVAGTIDGDTNFDLEFQDESITIIANASGWWIK